MPKSVNPYLKRALEQREFSEVAAELGVDRITVIGLYAAAVLVAADIDDNWRFSSGRAEALTYPEIARLMGADDADLAERFIRAAGKRGLFVHPGEFVALPVLRQRRRPGLRGS